jgi:ABC-type multidrug transport system fused ATPase/permease subunit
MQIFDIRPKGRRQHFQRRPGNLFTLHQESQASDRGCGPALARQICHSRCAASIEAHRGRLGEPEALAALPVLLLAGYAFLRFTVTLFAELRDAVFARATQQTISGFALKVFGHLHSLPPRFHLSRQTGALSRDIERGTRGVGFVLSIALFNVVPTLVEITLVLGILLASYDIWFSLIILGTFVL